MNTPTAPLKAIETVYKGYRFRSRLEARWAVFLDALKTPWEYEAQGYDLDGVRYLPDFWLPREEIFIEAKGPEPTEAEQVKMQRLAKTAQRDVLIVRSDPMGTEKVTGFTG